MVTAFKSSERMRENGRTMEFVGSYDMYDKPLGIEFDKYGKPIVDV